MVDDTDYRTTIYLRPEQKVIQKLYPQQFSEMVRNLADALIQGTNLGDLPPELAEEVVIARQKAEAQQIFIDRQHQRKTDFFNFLDSQNLPAIQGRIGKRRARQIARDFVTPYRAKTGNILPDCYVGPFLKEYFDDSETSGKMDDAWKLVQEQIVGEFMEEIAEER